MRPSPSPAVSIHGMAMRRLLLLALVLGTGADMRVPPSSSLWEDPDSSSPSAEVEPSVEPILCPAKCECRLDVHPRLVNCSGRRLVAFPVDDVPMDVEVLDLSRNLLKTVPRDLPAWEHLEILSLAENELEDFPPRALQQLVALHVLDLSRNKIASLRYLKPDRFIMDNPVLQVLNLSGNALQDLGHGSFTSLASESLRELDVSHCAISSVNGQESLRELPGLRVLSLRGNPLAALPSGLLAPALHQLDLSCCRLRAVPRTFLGTASLPQLTHLVLSDNPDLEAFDAPDGPLAWSSSLQYLRASGCAVQDLGFLSALPNLTHVEMRANRIGRIHPLTLQDNGPLLYLNLADNKLDELPAHAFDGPGLLKEVDISGNKVTSIHPETFVLHRALRKLNVSRNPLVSLNLSAPTLRILDASHGEVSHVAEGLLDSLPQLRHLNLSHNPLPQLPRSLASPGNDAALHTLDLSFCRLTDVQVGALDGLPLLQTVDLRGNRLTEPLKMGAFDENPVVHHIYLADNPWRCDCKNVDFRNFVNFIEGHPTKDDSTQIACHAPEEVAGTSMRDACLAPSPSTLAGAEGWLSLLLVVLCGVAIAVVVVMVRRMAGRKGARRRAEAERRAREDEEAERRRQQRRHERRVQQQQQEELLRQHSRPHSHVSCSDPYDPPSYEEAVLMDRMTQEDPENPEDRDDSQDGFQTEPQGKVARLAWSHERQGSSLRHSTVLEEGEEEEEEEEEVAEGQEGPEDRHPPIQRTDSPNSSPRSNGHCPQPLHDPEQRGRTQLNDSSSVL